MNKVQEFIMNSLEKENGLFVDKNLFLTGNRFYFNLKDNDLKHIDYNYYVSHSLLPDSKIKKLIKRFGFRVERLSKYVETGSLFNVCILRHPCKISIQVIHKDKIVDRQKINVILKSLCTDFPDLFSIEEKRIKFFELFSEQNQEIRWKH